jgi:hypothetical protein
MRGQVSGNGPANPAQKAALLRSGWKPYSINLFGTWYPYNRLDPLGATLAISADFTEATALTDWDEIEQQDMAEAAANVIAAVGGTVLSKSYMTNTAQLADTLGEALRGEAAQAGEKYAAGVVSSLVPFSSLLAGVETIADPAARVPQDPGLAFAQDFVGRIRSRIPGLSEALPIKHDLWGRPIMSGSGNGMYDMVNPFVANPSEQEPIDKEMLHLNAYISEPPKSFSLSAAELGAYLDEASPMGVSVNLRNDLQIHERWKQLSGNELKLEAFGNLGAKDLLNAIVTGKHELSETYEQLGNDPKGGQDSKIGFIREIVGEYRSQAKRQLLQEFPELRDMMKLRVLERMKYREQETQQ